MDDVQLGPGRPVEAVRPCLASSGPGRPQLWMSDAAVPDAALVWRRLVDRFPQTGLWPLVLHSLAGDDSRPWDAGELEPASEAAVDTLDPARLLAEGWADALVPIGQNPRVAHLDPFGARFPGLAGALPRSAPSSVSLTALAPGGAARIGLVRCRRPADAVALAGWLGAINVTGPAEISAVLRSWEERFGVVLAGLGFDTMTLLVPHPPVDEQQGRSSPPRSLRSALTRSGRATQSRSRDWPVSSSTCRCGICGSTDAAVGVLHMGAPC